MFHILKLRSASCCYTPTRLTAAKGLLLKLAPLVLIKHPQVWTSLAVEPDSITKPLSPKNFLEPCNLPAHDAGLLWGGCVQCPCHGPAGTLHTQ